ncbi:hypothetical protein O3G_MSEX004077 [Manduca sexta]|uniref:Uncharacterized protein n=1 Tax=Manduca sexta TaxID=7130 RepID=A0A921YW91_MANSE|nr:hypothetical protein O3G_MSEX004077 [Manduca sexta]
MSLTTSPEFVNMMMYRPRPMGGSLLLAADFRGRTLDLSFVYLTLVPSIIQTNGKLLSILKPAYICRYIQTYTYLHGAAEIKWPTLSTLIKNMNLVPLTTFEFRSICAPIRTLLLEQFTSIFDITTTVTGSSKCNCKSI